MGVSRSDPQRVWMQDGQDADEHPLVRAFHAELCVRGRPRAWPHAGTVEYPQQPRCVRAFLVVERWLRETAVRENEHPVPLMGTPLSLSADLYNQIGRT